MEIIKYEMANQIMVMASLHFPMRECLDETSGLIWDKNHFALRFSVGIFPTEIISFWLFNESSGLSGHDNSVCEIRYKKKWQW